MSVENIVIIGTGAQMRYALEIFSYYPGIKVCAVVKAGNDIDEKVKKNLKGINIIDDFDSYEKIASKKDTKTIVCVSDSKKKEYFVNRLEKMGIQLTNAIHPKAVIAKTAKIGKNVIINAGAIIQPYAVIGDSVMIHAQVDVEHDCTVEDYVNLAPGVKLAGWVTVKKGAVVYTNACVIPCVTIGSYAIVGAGTTVRKNIPGNVTVTDKPVRIAKQNVKNK